MPCGLGAGEALLREAMSERRRSLWAILKGMSCESVDDVGI